jgi:hypothetical protein
MPLPARWRKRADAAGQPVSCGVRNAPNQSSNAGAIFGTSRMAAVVSQMMPQPLVRALSPWMLRAPWIVRHLVLDRWFLHADQPALAGG